MECTPELEFAAIRMVDMAYKVVEFE